MKLRRWLTTSGLAGVAISSLAVFVNCFTDTQDDQTVQVISDCDLAQLQPLPSAEATVKVYVETAEALGKAASDAAGELQRACSAIDADLGLPVGSDAPTACQPIIQRIAALKKKAGQGQTFLRLNGGPSCTTDPNAKAACVATCAGPCDPSKCDPTGLQGTCPGTCTGVCVTTGTGPCNGACLGSCQNDLNNTCLGECLGQCNAGTYQGDCASGCVLGFAGLCRGTCTGQCDGTPINDGGIDAEGGPPPPPVPPSNADGNCKTNCAGQCSSGAAGACGRACAGQFAAGVCSLACTGTCITGAGSGCAPTTTDASAPIPTCDGTCTGATGDAGAPCTGLCQGTCSQAFQNPICTGKLNCGQNAQCDFACSAKQAMAVTCTPPDAVEVDAVTDPAFYAALKKDGAALVVIGQKLAALRAAAGFISERSVSDFAAVGATGDRVRQCVARGIKAADAAGLTISTLANAYPAS